MLLVLESEDCFVVPPPRIPPPLPCSEKGIQSPPSTQGGILSLLLLLPACVMLLPVGMLLLPACFLLLPA